jgi:hypothetical protein
LAKHSKVKKGSLVEDPTWEMSIGVGIFLMVLGAILAFAVEAIPLASTSTPSGSSCCSPA